VSADSERYEQAALNAKSDAEREVALTKLRVADEELAQLRATAAEYGVVLQVPPAEPTPAVEP